MSYPFISEKYKQPSLVSPEDLLFYEGEKQKRLPSRAVLCFSRVLAQSFRKRKDFKGSCYKTDMDIDMYGRVKEVSVSVISHFGIGAPAAVVCLEKLRALGVREFISLGTVGSLNSALKTGEKVLALKAFRNEGCSYHYKAPGPYMEIPKSEVCMKLIKKLKLKTVTSWTTDAPFRETREEVLYFQSKGVDCVEMESASLMAAGEYYGVSVFCTGVVSDHLSPKGWIPKFFDPVVKKSLYEVLNQVLYF